MSVPTPAQELVAADGRPDQEAAGEQRLPDEYEREGQPPVHELLVPQHEDAQEANDDGQGAEGPVEAHPGDVSGPTMGQVLTVLRATRFCWATEDDLQRGIAAALEEGGFQPMREARLDRHNRIDLLVGRVGVEVKVAGVWRDVARQVRRYCESDRLDGLVVVTSRVNHSRIPAVVARKPVAVHLVGSVL